MNPKTLFTLAALCGALQFAHGQSGGAGGSGSGSGSSGSGQGAASGSAGGGSSTAPAGSPNVGSAGGSNVGALSTSGAPNTSPTMPSRSTLETNYKATEPTDANGRGTLPPGLRAAPAQPGVSSISGLRTADIPAVSAGTAPIGPDGTTSSSRTSTAPAAAGSNTGVTDPSQIAAHPQTNPRIGLGHGVTTVVPTPPPAAVQPATPPSPTTDASQVWVAGHYSWLNGQWTWVDAAWQRPPNPGAAWVPGSFDAQNMRWTEGHWDTSGATTRDRAQARENAREGTATPRR